MSDPNLFEENNRLKVENLALKDGLRVSQNQLNELGAEFFGLRSKLADVISMAQKIEQHNERLTKAGEELQDWVLIMRHEHPKDIEAIRSVCLKWKASKEDNPE
jgi:hypothetical protein